MRLSSLFLTALVVVLTGCTSLERGIHMYSRAAPKAQVFDYQLGGSSTYYTFSVGRESPSDTLFFFYGGSGCSSWKSVMPGYVKGLTVNARVFVLNKRFVPDRSTGLFSCAEAFHLANNPAQWLADYSEFLNAQIHSAESKPKNVVLVGVSEGSVPAAMLAAISPHVTHLALIGSGGYSLRKSLRTLKHKGVVDFEVDAGWEKIAADPRSIQKNWYGNPYRWWSDFLDVDPLPELLKLNIPIVLGIGEQDQSVPVESAKYLEHSFKTRGKDQLTVHVFPGADHRLVAPGGSYRDEFFTRLSRLLDAP